MKRLGNNGYNRQQRPLNKVLKLGMTLIWRETNSSFLN
jgi:hypothetical protein